MVLKWTRTKPEPLKYFEQELNLNPNCYLKRFDTLYGTDQFWLKNVEKISKVPLSTLRNVNPTRAITWLVGVTTYCKIFKGQSIYTK